MMTLALSLLIAIQNPSEEEISLPQRCKEILNRTLPGWQILMVPEYSEITGLPKEPRQERPRLYKCYLNEDKLAEYAVGITVGEGICLVEYYIVFLADSSDFSFFLLGSYPASLGIAGRTSFFVTRRGAKVPAFDDYYEMGIPDPVNNEGLAVLQTDAVVFLPTSGCCETTIVFRNGKFRRFTSSD